MMMPGFPIDVVVTSSAKARERDGIATGEDKYYFFEAVAIDYQPVVAASDDFQGGKVLSQGQDDIQTVKGRNRFFEPLPVDAELTVVIGADGIATILVWLCDA
ncbi:MAG: hypothetical protein AAF539_00810 [Planctomycetota bacterium]